MGQQGRDLRGRSNHGGLLQGCPWSAAASLPFSKWLQVKAARPEAHGHGPQARPLLLGPSCLWLGVWGFPTLSFTPSAASGLLCISSYLFVCGKKQRLRISCWEWGYRREKLINGSSARWC